MSFAKDLTDSWAGMEVISLKVWVADPAQALQLQWLFDPQAIKGYMSAGLHPIFQVQNYTQRPYTKPDEDQKNKNQNCSDKFNHSIP